MIQTRVNEFEFPIYIRILLNEVDRQDAVSEQHIASSKSIHDNLMVEAKLTFANIMQ